MKLSIRCIVNIAILFAIITSVSSIFSSLNVAKNRKRIDKLESFLTNQHGFDASKELGFYKPFDDRESK